MQAQSRTCRVCGGSLKTGKFFCSKRCKGSAMITKVERACEQCGRLYEARGAAVASGRAHFCSQACAGKAKAVAEGLSLAERLAKYTAPANGQGCRLWTGAVDSSGYGVLQYHGRPIATHRAAWEVAFGPITNGDWVLHRCDTPLCLEPIHLFLGTAADNNADMIAKGRGHVPSGEDHWRARLTAADVISLRLDRTQGMTYAALASKYGVSLGAINAAANGRSWRGLS